MLLILKTTPKAGGVTPDASVLESSGGAIYPCGSGRLPLGKSHVLVMTIQGIEKQFTRIDLERN